MVVCLHLLIPQWSCFEATMKCTATFQSFTWLVYATQARAWISEEEEWHIICLHCGLTGRRTQIKHQPDPENSESLLRTLVWTVLRCLFLTPVSHVRRWCREYCCGVVTLLWAIHYLQVQAWSRWAMGTQSPCHSINPIHSKLTQ